MIPPIHHVRLHLLFTMITVYTLFFIFGRYFLCYDYFYGDSVCIVLTSHNVLSGKFNTLVHKPIWTWQFFSLICLRLTFQISKCKQKIVAKRHEIVPTRYKITAFACFPLKTHYLDSLQYYFNKDQ